MCGVAGIVNLKGDGIKNESLKAMCNKMVHRGPDDEGIYISNQGSGVRGQKKRNSRVTVGLGHRRLSIIDLSSAGHQPMCNEDETVWIIQNGEIYNYRELRKDLENNGHKFKSNSDTEVIIHLYEEHGKACVKYLLGMFAFAIWDINKSTLFLARDRAGKKPLVYSFQDDAFYFASELSSLMSAGILSNAINEEAVHYYLTFGYIPAPLTIYKKVFKLPPAHSLVLNSNSDLVIENYWKLDFSKKIKITEEDAADETLRLLKDATKARLNSDVPLGAFLSGGIDSSAVVGLMAEMSPNKIKTFSIGFDDSDYNELEHAKRVAEKFDTEHHEFIVHPNALEILPLLVERYGEPYADSSAIPTYYVSQQTKQYVTVALNGDGGDELFAGYERYQAILISEMYNKIPSLIRESMVNNLIDLFPDSINPKNRFRRIKRFINGAKIPLNQRYLKWIGIFDDVMKQELYSEDFANNYARSDPVKFLDPHLNNNSNNIHLLDRLLLADTMTYLPGDLLTKVDITSMANSLECRSPFLDHRLMEFAASIPHEHKIKRFTKKNILKKAVSKLIPHENIYRRKMGFGIPVGRWFRNELKSFLKETLLSPASLNRGYFKPDILKKLVEDHIRGAYDYSFQLWALLMLELWHLKFIDKPS